MHIRYFTICLYIFFSSVIYCSGQNIKGKIIDSDSEKPIPLVTISIIGGKNIAITNSEGEFEFTSAFPVKLKLSHIAYQLAERSIKETEDNVIIKLKLANQKLDLVTIKPMSGFELLKAATKKLKSFENNLFYGNAFIIKSVAINNEPFEFFESYLDISLTTTSIKGWLAKKSRFAKFKVDLNMEPYELNKFDPLDYNSKFNLIPVSDFSNYNISINRYFRRDDEAIAVISCNFKGDKTALYFNRVYYVGLNNHKIYRADILFFNLYSTIFETQGLEDSKEIERSPMTRTVSIIFNDHQTEEVPLVESISTKTSSVINDKLKSYAINDEHLFIFYELDKNLNKKQFNNKSKFISPTKPYDASFWKDNPIVKKSALEENFIKVIESKSAFGKKK